MIKPLFITFEGGEGSGKSTQIQMLYKALRNQGKDVCLTREPGGSSGAEEIRSLLLKGATTRWDALTEILLFSAARRDHLVKTVWPALEKGSVVISDRFYDSTTAYQGYGYGYDSERISILTSLYTMIAGDFKPDLTFVLDINPHIGLNRSKNRCGNVEQRFEEMDVTFHENLRHGFLMIAHENPDRCVVIDANQTPECVHADIMRVLINWGYLENT